MGPRNNNNTDPESHRRQFEECGDVGIMQASYEGREKEGDVCLRIREWAKDKERIAELEQELAQANKETAEIARQGLRREAVLEEEKQQLQQQLTAVTAEREQELAQANKETAEIARQNLRREAALREEKQQLQQQLTAVTAERDETRKQLTAVSAERDQQLAREEEWITLPRRLFQDIVEAAKSFFKTDSGSKRASSSPSAEPDSKRQRTSSPTSEIM